jgi:hypothetical protein
LPLFSVNLGFFEGNFHLEGKAEGIESVLTATVKHEIYLVAAAAAACITINEPFVLLYLNRTNYLPIVSCYSFCSILCCGRNSVLINLLELLFLFDFLAEILILLLLFIISHPYFP